MASRYDWFAWHRNYRTDDWFITLSDSEKWAWVAFLSYANEFDWRVKICSGNALAPLLSVTSVTLVTLLESAVKNEKVLVEDGFWFVKNGPKYRQKRDNTGAERQRKFKDKQRDMESVSNASNGTVTPGNAKKRLPVKTDSEESYRDSYESPTKTDSELLAAVEVWNLNKSPSWPSCLKIKQPLKTRFAAANKDAPINLLEIVNRAKASDFLSVGKFVNMLWIYSRSEKTGNLNAVDILDGRYDNRSNGTVKGYQAGNLSKERKFEF